MTTPTFYPVFPYLTAFTIWRVLWRAMLVTRRLWHWISMHPGHMYCYLSRKLWLSSELRMRRRLLRRSVVLCYLQQNCLLVEAVVWMFLYTLDAGCVYKCESADDCNFYQYCSPSNVCEAVEGKSCKKDSECAGDTFYCDSYTCKSRVKEHAGCYNSKDCGMLAFMSVGSCMSHWNQLRVHHCSH